MPLYGYTQAFIQNKDIQWTIAHEKKFFNLDHQRLVKCKSEPQ